MSLDDTRQTAPYVPPPPPPRQGRSPWLWVGLGCGLLVLLTFGGCVAATLLVGNRMQEEMRRAEKEPLTEQQVRAALRPVPIYPGAKVDIPETKMLRVVTKTVGGFTRALTRGKMTMEMAVFRAPAPPDKVIGWYDTKFADWRKLDPRSGGVFSGQTEAITDSRGYARGDQQVIVQVGPHRGEEKRSRLKLFLLSGIPER